MQNNQKIPAGWNVKKLEECFSFSAGGDVDKDCFSETKDDLHPYPIYANALTNEGLYGYSSKYKVKEECITITGRGDIGNVFYRKGYFTPIVRLITAIPNAGIKAKFMSYACSQIHFFDESTGVPQLTVPQVQWYKILLPPLPEQEKIAGILGTWDEAIEKLSDLIEQKKLLKKGLMQKLLTGQTRLPGFTQPWKEVKLGEILVERKEYTTQNNQVTILTSSRKGIFKQEDYFDKQVASENNIGYKILRRYDFTYRSMTDDDVYCFNQLVNEDVGAVSPAYSVFYCRNVPNLLIKEVFNSKYFGYQLLKISQGGTRKSLKFSALKTLKIRLPSDISEQQAIADVLSTADDEINLLNQKLEAIKEQKKGLMQQLLTGQIRVKGN